VVFEFGSVVQIRSFTDYIDNLSMFLFKKIMIFLHSFPKNKAERALAKLND